MARAWAVSQGVASLQTAIVCAWQAARVAFPLRGPQRFVRRRQWYRVTLSIEASELVINPRAIDDMPSAYVSRNVVRQQQGKHIRLKVESYVSPLGVRRLRRVRALQLGHRRSQRRDFHLGYRLLRQGRRPQRLNDMHAANASLHVMPFNLVIDASASGAGQWAHALQPID